MKTAIVVTTINIPKLLLEYADNFNRYGHEDVGFIIIGDKKTPDGDLENLSKQLKNKCFESEYFDIAKQEDWLKRFPILSFLIPYNSNNRRNIGHLIAAEREARIIIELDDDNYVGKDDYLLAHSIVGSKQKLLTVSSENKWFNICDMLEKDPLDRMLYPRGFPCSRKGTTIIDFNMTEGKVVLNEGLWVNCPDVDAVSILNEPIKTTGLKEHKRIMLAPGTFSPINAQNTAFSTEILPAYYYVLMGEKIEDNIIGRYDDILSGFFVKKIIDHMDDRAVFGIPLANHKRNIHNIFRDAQEELPGMLLMDILTPIIESMTLTANTYADTYLELSNKLNEVSCTNTSLIKFRSFIFKITKIMRVWVDVCRELSIC